MKLTFKMDRSILLKFSNFINKGGKNKKSEIIAKAIDIIDNCARSEFTLKPELAKTLKPPNRGLPLCSSRKNIHSRLHRYPGS